MGRKASVEHICIPCNVMMKGIKNHFTSRHPDVPMVLDGATQTSCLFCGEDTEYAPTLRDHRMYCSKSCKRRHENEVPECPENVEKRTPTIRYPKYVDSYRTYVCRVYHESMFLSTIAGNEDVTFGTVPVSSEFDPQEAERFLQHNFSLLRTRMIAQDSIPYHSAMYKEFLEPVQVESPLRIGTRDIPTFFHVVEEYIKSLKDIEWYISFGTRWRPNPQYLVKTKGQYPYGIRVYKNKDQFVEDQVLPKDRHEIDSTPCYVEGKSLKWE